MLAVVEWPQGFHAWKTMQNDMKVMVMVVEAVVGCVQLWSRT